MIEKALNELRNRKERARQKAIEMFERNNRDKRLTLLELDKEYQGVRTDQERFLDEVMIVILEQ
jgi:hypothetical protein